MAVRDSLEGGVRASVFSSRFDGTRLVYSNSSAVFFFVFFFVCVCVCVCVFVCVCVNNSSKPF